MFVIIQNFQRMALEWLHRNTAKYYRKKMVSLCNSSRPCTKPRIAWKQERNSRRVIQHREHREKLVFCSRLFIERFVEFPWRPSKIERIAESSPRNGTRSFDAPSKFRGRGLLLYTGKLVFHRLHLLQLRPDD